MSNNGKVTQRDLLGRKLYEFYPKITPYSSGFLDIDKTHSLYWEQSGNPDGIPIIVLHGGPGEGSSAASRRFFDPEHYRIILLDQRGAGRSQPLGSIENNSLKHLVSDLEKLRKHLRISKWHLFGGSWGSTLALSYAIKYPNKCISMILRSIFLLSQKEIDWYLYGMKTFYPEAWKKFSEFIPKEERNDLLGAYYKRLYNKEPHISMDAAQKWYVYECACSSFIPKTGTLYSENQYHHALAMAKLEAHFYKNEILPPEKAIINYIDKIRHIPAIIIQGRYDVICPINTAYDLHQEWPEADLVIVPDGGHSATDPSVKSSLINASEQMKNLN